MIRCLTESYLGSTELLDIWSATSSINIVSDCIVSETMSNGTSMIACSHLLSLHMYQLVACSHHSCNNLYHALTKEHSVGCLNATYVSWIFGM